MNKCCFYGSLRKPMYNYERFVNFYGTDSMIYEITTKIPGFELYDLGDYPAAIKTFEDTNIVVDLFSLSDECYKSIQYMESFAGYHEDTVYINDESYSIFLFQKEKLNEKKLIELGDWLMYKLTSKHSIK